MKEETIKETIETEEIKQYSIFPYTKEKRFAVAKKLPYNERFRADFKFLHDTKESAETEAVRLSNKYNDKFYVVEIQAITSNG